MEAIVQVNPGETLYITVGSGGQAGGYGLVTTISENEQVRPIVIYADILMRTLYVSYIRLLF